MLRDHLPSRGHLLAIIGVAAMIRATAAAILDADLVNDPAQYHGMAVSIATEGSFGSSPVLLDGGPTAFRPPLYPVLLGAAYRLAGLDLTVAHVVQVIIGSAAVAAIVGLAAVLHGRRVAAGSGWAAALYPPFVLWDAQLLTEPLFATMLLSAVMVIARWDQDPQLPRRWLLLVGALTGLLVLTRPTGLPVGAVLTVGVFVLARPRLGTAVAARQALLVVLVTVVVLAPWAVRNARVLGQPVVSSTSYGFTLAGVYNDVSRSGSPLPAVLVAAPVDPYRELFARATNEAELGEALARGALRYAREHPGYAATVPLRNLVRLLGFDEVEYGRAALQGEGLEPDLAVVVRWSARALFVLVAIAIWRIRPRSNVALLVGVLALVLLVSTAVVLGVPRLRAPVEALAMPWAVAGAHVLVDRVRRRPDGSVQRR